MENIRWTSKKDEDMREPRDTGTNIFNDTLAKLDRFSHRSSKGPFIKDVRKIFGIFDLPSPLSAFWPDL